MIDLTKNEKRLIILYILNQVKMAITNKTLSEIIANSTPIDWFENQLILKSLVEDHLVNNINDRYEISTEGIQIVKEYYNEILLGIREKIDQYIEKNFDKMSDLSKILANFKKENNSYIVNLTIFEMDEELIEIKLKVPTRELANSICSKFKKQPIAIYHQVIALLQ